MINLFIHPQNLNNFIAWSADWHLGKCHFLPEGGGAPENWGDQVLCLRSKGGSKDFSN